MKYTIQRETVAPRYLAVVRERRGWEELGGGLIPLLDRVYVAVRSGRIVQTGHNVFLYRDGTRDGATVEIGVEVGGPFTDDNGVTYSRTPAGEVASTTHVGPYAALGAAHDAILSWCQEQRLRRANVWWEVYGDWEEDEAQLRTDIFYLLDAER